MAALLSGVPAECFHSTSTKLRNGGETIPSNEALVLEAGLLHCLSQGTSSARSTRVHWEFTRGNHAFHFMSWHRQACGERAVSRETREEPRTIVRSLTVLLHVAREQDSAADDPETCTGRAQPPPTAAPGPRTAAISPTLVNPHLCPCHARTNTANSSSRRKCASSLNY